MSNEYEEETSPSLLRDLSSINDQVTSPPRWRQLLAVFKNLIMHRVFLSDFERQLVSRIANDSDFVNKYSKPIKIIYDGGIELTLSYFHYVPSKIRKTILFVHGLAGQTTQFEYLLKDLIDKDIELISIDLPGFGNSKRKVNASYKNYFKESHSRETIAQIESSVSAFLQKIPPTPETLSRIIELVLQKVSINEVSIVSHSYGTHVANKLLKRVKTNEWILFSPPSFTGIDHRSKWLTVFIWFPILFHLFRSFDRLGGLNSNSLNRYIWTGNSPALWTLFKKLKQFRWNLDTDSTAYLKYIQSLKLNKLDDLDDIDVKSIDIFVGSNDKVTPPSASKTAAEYLRGKNHQVDLTELNECSHSIMLDQKVELSSCVVQKLVH
ncbi:BA75_03264T0 [Komagataella pastoris]|uniref:BA75_03264T0 n=1 Tax=Komagataella pastoris TaxID=4922 RepID=A0A1B2JD09_PICPA|nr:BA75_03264T0 [Komagataella pastoris]